MKNMAIFIVISSNRFDTMDYNKYNIKKNTVSQLT